MEDKYQRPCFDSSVFLGGLNGEICDGIKRRIVFQHIWDKAKDGEFPVLLSAITIAEVYKKKNKTTPSDPVLDEFLECINESFVEVIEVDRVVALHAHRLCRQFSSQHLMPNDAMVLACALRAQCDVLLAWDGPLLNVQHDKIRIEKPAMIQRLLTTPSEKASVEEIKLYEEATKKAANT